MHKIAILLILATSMAWAGTPHGVVTSERTAVARLPVYFEPNLGQLHPDVRFLSRGAKLISSSTPPAAAPGMTTSSIRAPTPARSA